MRKRSEAIAAIAAGLGGLTAASTILAQAQTMEEVPSSPEGRARTSLHQEIRVDASPSRIYEMLLDSKRFAAFTGMPATIDSAPGGAFSMFAGMITGRNVELISAQRIVQAWRPGSWAPGVYSIVRFELEPQASGTLVVLDHTGFPQGKFDSLSSGWGEHYWTPLKDFLARTGLTHLRLP